MNQARNLSGLRMAQMLWITPFRTEVEITEMIWSPAMPIKPGSQLTVAIST